MNTDIEPGRTRKTGRVAGMTTLCMILLSVLVTMPPANGQTRLRLNTGTLRELFDQITKQSGYQVFYEEKVDASKTVSFQPMEGTLDQILKEVLTPQRLTYEILNKTIVVSAQDVERGLGIRITGVVCDENKAPLSGATVRVRGTLKGVVTDQQGRFTIQVDSPKRTLTVEHVGYILKEIKVEGKSEITVGMEPFVYEMDDVVATGYFSKTKNSFTGTAVVIKGEELRNVSSLSIFDALKVFDPSFKVVDERGLYGSDPNAVPNRIEIRGQNSFPEISGSTMNTYTSLPVFILDGFEITVEQAYDLDMNRLESVTVLKDAAASAIYGSRAANGVVVIQSRIPQAGKLQLSYTFSGSLQVPDISSYNLMNAAEALEYQRLTGVFDAVTEGEDAGNRLNTYNLILKEVMEGTNTYWISKPLRVALRQKHSIFIEGAVSEEVDSKHNLRYQINLGLGTSNGVMKGSQRTQYSAGTKLLFNSGKLYITNDLQFSGINSAESPYGNFSSYTQALPYYREKDENGRYYRTLTMKNVAPPGIDLDYALDYGSSWQSPVYEAKYLSSFTEKASVDFYNNLGVSWNPTASLLVKGNFRVSNSSSRSDAYISPMSYHYIQLNDDNVNTPDVILDRGKYTLSNSSLLGLSGNVVVSYTERLDRHMIQAIVGGELQQKQNKRDNYTVTGFMDDALAYLSYANQFYNYGRPSGNDAPVRSAGAFSNVNYSYDGRYMFDLTGRIDGSSLFGRNQFTAPFWSTGLRWNIANEQFMSGVSFIDQLTVRATIGTIGNQNFTLNQAMTLYTWLPETYGPFMGATVTTLGNSDLTWQTTLNRNIGLELSLWRGLVKFDINHYSNITKDNVTDISIAPSIGFPSYKTNMGDLQNQGWDFRLSVTPVRVRDWTLNVHLNGTRNKNTIKSISESMKRYNDMVGRVADKEGTNVFLFEEGKSMNTIYAVRSLGIDPGTGREMFLTKEGKRTFTWNANDQVAVGNREPAFSGYCGLNLRYKEWDMSAIFNYSTGADVYNYTLHEKVEGVNPMVNNDRRVLSERWKEPGDVARYKSVRDQTTTKSTSRFVQKEHMTSLSSLRVSYTMPVEKFERLPISMLRFSVTVNDLFYMSTIKQERGLYYPFARTINLSAQINF